jgi:hypothetical protein
MLWSRISCKPALKCDHQAEPFLILGLERGRERVQSVYTLALNRSPVHSFNHLQVAEFVERRGGRWRMTEAISPCKAVYAGSIPTSASTSFDATGG